MYGLVVGTLMSLAERRVKLIVIPVFETKVSAAEQRIKIIEESIEVYKAKSKEHELEELCDVIQAAINRMEQMASATEINEAFGLHFVKIKSRGWEVKRFLKLEG